MPAKRIEALADAIGFLNRIHEPESRAYQNRNPGLCKAFSFKQLGATDDQGYRVFTSIIGGMRFLHQDLIWKCSGQTRAKGLHGKLKPNSTLVDLLKTFKLYYEETTPDGAVVSDESISNMFQVVSFLNTALKTAEIKDTTELRYFTEGE